LSTLLLRTVLPLLMLSFSACCDDDGILLREDADDAGGYFVMGDRLVINPNFVNCEFLLY
jgi:hypothetical protein